MTDTTPAAERVEKYADALAAAHTAEGAMAMDWLEEARAAIAVADAERPGGHPMTDTTPGAVGRAAFALDEAAWERIARAALADACLCGHMEAAHKDQRDEWTSCACGCLGFTQPREPEATR